MVGISLFVIFCILAIFSILLNKDVFSPSKFYFVYLAVYFSAVFINKYSEIIYFLYLIFLIIGMYLIFLDGGSLKKNIAIKIHEKKSKVKKEYYKTKRMYGLLWIMTIIPIYAQLHLIQYMGGLENYINSIGLRVFAWRGQGITLELIKIYGILNLIYFSIMLISKERKFKKWLLYAIHFIGFCFIGLLSGSRSGLLFNIGFMVIAYNYLVSRVRIKHAVITLAMIVFLASLIGVARNGIKWDEGELKTALSASSNYFELSNFKYGIQPLELVFSSNIVNLKYGLTFITPITNIIPRSVWPTKPDTGGVVITKQYLANAWGGYSNISTGIIAEGVINFGRVMGTMFGIILFISLTTILNLFYKKIAMLNACCYDIKKIFILITYIYTLVAIPSLIYTEWTNTVLGLLLKVGKLLIIYVILKIFGGMSQSTRIYSR